MEIIDKAIQLGACEKSAKANDLRTLVALFFLPQGVEFCIEHNYPGLDEFRKHDAEQYGVYTEKEVNFKNKDAALIGSKGKLEFSGVDKGYTVILMHGATAEITLKNYAVVKLEKSKDSKVTVINDGTGVIL